MGETRQFVDQARNTAVLTITQSLRSARDYDVDPKVQPKLHVAQDKPKIITHMPDGPGGSPRH